MSVALQPGTRWRNIQSQDREDKALAQLDKPRASGRTPLVLAAAFSMLLLAGTLWAAAEWTRARGLADLAESSGHLLRLVVESLSGELAKHQSTPVLLSHNPHLSRIVTGATSPAEIEAASTELARLARVTGASDIYLMNTAGTTVAASNHDQPRSFIGQNFSYRPYFTGAIKGQPSRYFALGTTSGERGYYFSHPLFDGRYVVGVAVVKIQVGQLEAAWRAADHEIMVVDEDGVVFLSSRPEWVLRTLAPLNEQARQRIAEHRRYDAHPLAPLDIDMGETQGTLGRLIALASAAVPGAPGAATSDTEGRTGRARHYLMQALKMPEAGWTVHILARTTSVASRVNTAMALVLATFAALTLAAVAMHQRRRRVAERLQLQTSINTELERRVALRTDELTRANRQLEAEVAERRRAEGELRLAQSELVQAGKLAALGQMSAGLSHELNQPLAAIRSYADNARKFLERERVDAAGANLGSIVELTERMARIIRHLRTYARKEPTSVQPTSVTRAIDDSLSLLQRRIGDAGAKITVEAPDPHVMAIAGEVRLQQVLVNLIANALDAMKDRDDKSITISVREVDGTVVIGVADSGSGIPADNLSSVFDPFFTTKDVGEGLGLGLSITYGIVQQFGGTITARNRSEGGALFEVRLQSARPATENAA